MIFVIRTYDILASYAFLRVRHAIIPPHERLLQPVPTSVQENWPITGRLPFFVKWDFDLKFISRVHVNMANFDLVS